MNGTAFSSWEDFCGGRGGGEEGGTSFLPLS